MEQCFLSIFNFFFNFSSLYQVRHLISVLAKYVSSDCKKLEQKWEKTVIANINLRMPKTDRSIIPVKKRACRLVNYSCEKDGMPFSRKH